MRPSNWEQESYNNIKEDNRPYMDPFLKDMIEKAVKTKKRINLPVEVHATIPAISEESIATFSLTLSVKTR